MSGFGSMPLDDVLGFFRDIALIFGVVVIGWKVHAVVQPIVDFFKLAIKTMKRAEKHMDAMEEGMTLLLENHLKHIHAELKKHNGSRYAALAEELEETTTPYEEVVALEKFDASGERSAASGENSQQPQSL